MKKILMILLRTVKWTFIVLFVYLLSLFFRSQRISGHWLEPLVDRMTPTNLVVHVGSVRFGFVEGLRVRQLRVYDRSAADSLTPMVSARTVSVRPFQRLVEVDELTYARLPDSYYEPENIERNARVEVKLPRLPRFSLVLNRPKILGIEPARVVADVESTNERLMFERMRLTWPDKEDEMAIEGFCTVDFNTQFVTGSVAGSARQAHIRPLLVALDLPSALPYMDAFTEVPGKVPACCSWKVNLVNSDFDLDLGLDPTLGRYNGVPMKKARGRIRLNVRTRGTSLNYRNEIGPIVAEGLHGEPLEGSVVIVGENGTNVVSVVASSALPAAQLLKIGGFTGDYVDESVVGRSTCDLTFKFPRSMGNDLSLLNGRGHLEIRDGQLMRMKGFAGLLEYLSDKVPGVSLLTDSTQARCDYTIENGCLKTDGMFIEGAVFSIKLWGKHDFVKDELDFTVRVRFVKEESMVGKVIHTVTWPFTKLLLEFRLKGSSEKPEWHYISVIDRVVEAVK